MTINIDDYLTEEEKKEIIIQQFAAVATKSSIDEVARVITNEGYYIVVNALNEVFDGDVEKAIKDKAIQNINKMSEYLIFRRPDAWEREHSKGWEILQQCMTDNKDLINQKVVDHIEGINKNHLQGCLEEIIAEIIEKRIIGKGENNE